MLCSMRSVHINDLRKNGMALKGISPSAWTPHMCLTALKQNGLILGHIKNMARNMHVYWLSQMPSFKDVGNWMDLHMAAVESNGASLKYINSGAKTQRMCMAAVKSNYNALKHVPHCLHSEKMYRIALQQNGYALRYMSPNMKSIELCDIAIKNTPGAIKYAKYFINKQSICDEVVKKIPGRVLQWIPYGFRTKEICMACMKVDPTVYIYIPKTCLDDKFIIMSEEYHLLRILGINTYNNLIHNLSIAL